MNYINILSESIIWVYHLHCFCCSFAQLQNTRLPCPSLSPRVCSNSCPLNQWCHSTISSSLIPFSCLQTSQASGSFPVSHFFISGGQDIGVSASASLLPMNTQDWFPFNWLVWYPCSPRDCQSLLQHHSSKASILQCPAFFIVQLSHPYITTGKNNSFD